MMVNTAANSSMPFSTADVLNVNIVDKSSSIPNFFDWAPIVLSIIAIAISIYTIYQTKETHKATLASTFFASIFKEYLLEKFPNGRERICFENGRIKGHEILVDDLNKLRRDILYFKYADNDFYLALKKELQDLENYIVEAMNSQHDSTAQIKFLTDVDERMTKIFVRINKRHCGM